MKQTSNRNVLRLLAIGLVFHVVYIASVFDCYFVSPVVHGMQPFNAGFSEAKRLVLIVGDGLRADSLFSPDAFASIPSRPDVVAPYLMDIAQNRGAFGVSHTRVPTESRPGHVAIIGGMYEDVSAVTKVDFDSVFNRSSHTFSFGSPDILPMFARGATQGRVDEWSYDEEAEDFTKDATALDVWVLDELRTLFHNASSDAHLDKTLRNDKTVFFLHLLGLDTTGHAYRPHSKEYMDNIQVVDQIVKDTEQLFREFYGDEETSFVFTADHGMSKIGNHGDGDPDNTRTPLIAWGAGIRGPLPDVPLSSSSSPSSHDAYSLSWPVSHLRRQDVDQADIAPLMASLIGIDWPVNSVGVLPDIDPAHAGYLAPKGGEKDLARAALTNVRVIGEQYRVKHEMKAEHTLFYRPFAEIEDRGMFSNVARIERLVSAGEYTTAREESAKFIKLLLKGVRYLETYVPFLISPVIKPLTKDVRNDRYDRLLIQAIVIAGYFGWAAYASLSIFPISASSPPRRASRGHHDAVDLLASLTIGLFWGLFALQKAPWTFYVYVAFPCFFWREFLVKGYPRFSSYLSEKKAKIGGVRYAKAIGVGIVVVGVLQSMVAGYTVREVWSIGYGFLGLVWPLSWAPEKAQKHWKLLCFWVPSCLVVGVFPYLPVDKTESAALVSLGADLIMVTGVAQFAVTSIDDIPLSKGIPVGIQIVLVALAKGVTSDSIANLQAKKGLPFVNQVSGWVLFVLAPLLPILFSRTHRDTPTRLASIFLGFGVCFIILSISVEGLFYVAYSWNMYLWVEMEAAYRGDGTSLAVASAPGTQAGKGKKALKEKAKTNEKTEIKEPEKTKEDAVKLGAGIYEFKIDDLRIAMFFLFFVQVAFFGTGNVASISSFYLEPVYRLVPIFNPFLMATLLVFKIVAPYVILSAAFATLNARLRLPPYSLFLIALTLTDGMTITFFLSVTDTGSWLEIGQSISFFCITSLLLVWSAGICAAGEYVMSGPLQALPTPGEEKVKTE
ncbi:PigN-domain-containing protein [Coniophora puteana RWD-64-598 SS2]|uniref:GPI ethanolamine phosphate transferase 1 n=1 Tax=Coniophora puteana (strain RWD-64-598) TaxID=741705 RepID=A0A5M3M6V0_CONPW|nr:PigN-domain-containing protein [Coniophora puteana RWD-64-598 SS2]EIW74837.1 PigN-domain-containing protein [Coniophora puteana RWD-64-598 SS2]